MKKTYITLEELLALRGTDTVFYKETILDKYFKFKNGLVCRFTKDGKVEDVGVYVSDFDKPYILEPEEFKVEKTGLYKTRDGRIAFVGFLDLIDEVRGIIEGDQHTTDWFKNGHYHGDCDGYDLVEYVGDRK